MLKLYFFAATWLCVYLAKTQVLPGQEPALYQASYTIAFQTDSTNTASMVYENAVLLIGKNLAQFESAKKRLRDSALADKNMQNIGVALSQMGKIPKPKFLFEIYQYNNQIVYRDQILIERFQYTETPYFNWQLENEEKAIASYHCKMATCQYGGRTYTAWYTEEIPIPAGPYKFYGLPGFIVAIEDSTQQVKFQLTSFEKLPEGYMITTGEHKYTPVSRKVFLETLKKYKANPESAFNNMQAAFNLTIDDGAAKNNAMNRLKRENNLIEKM